MTQLGLLDSLADGLRRKREGLARVEANAESFVRVVRAGMIALSLRRGSVTADDAREFAKEYGLVAPSPYVWGSIFQRTRSGSWCKIGEEPSRTPSCNAHRNPRWQFIPAEEP